MSGTGNVEGSSEPDGSPARDLDGEELRVPPRPQFDPIPPAAVATERGIIGEPRPPIFDDFDDPAGGFRIAAIWLFGLLLAGAIAAWLTVFSASQATSEEVALPALERGVTSLTDLDALLDVQRDALAAQASAGDTVTLPGFPLRDVDVPTSAVTPDGTLDVTLLRDALLDRSARRIYTRGVAAFEGGEEIAVDASVLSAAGGIKTLLNLLSSDNHSAASFWLWPLGATALALGALLLATGSGFGRLIALGVAMVVGAAPVLIGGYALRLGLTMLAPDSGDPVVDEFVAIARQLTSLPIRNAMWTAGAGLAIVVPVAIVNAMFENSVRRPQSGDAASDAAS